MTKRVYIYILEENEQMHYLFESLCLKPGHFECAVVWQTHFYIHPRLNIGSSKAGMSRGMAALQLILNRFSVNNRKNMFVYQDTQGSVFYLR